VSANKTKVTVYGQTETEFGAVRAANACGRVVSGDTFVTPAGSMALLR
jgi:hypothetical protein